MEKGRLAVEHIGANHFSHVAQSACPRPRNLSARRSSTSKLNFNAADGFHSSIRGFAFLVSGDRMKIVSFARDFSLRETEAGTKKSLESR